MRTLNRRSKIRMWFATRPEHRELSPDQLVELLGKPAFVGTPGQVLRYMAGLRIEHGFSVDCKDEDWARWVFRSTDGRYWCLGGIRRAAEAG